MLAHFGESRTEAMIGFENTNHENPNFKEIREFLTEVER
jgi:hypothetical protein